MLRNGKRTSLTTDLADKTDQKIFLMEGVRSVTHLKGRITNNDHDTIKSVQSVVE